MVAMLAFLIFIIVGGIKLFETIYPVLEKLDQFVWAIVWLLIFLSVIPRLRLYTGNGIVFGTYIGGAIFWFVCLYVTYSLWGLIGVFIGVLFLGLGVFFTAVLALIFSGQTSTALYFGFILIQIYLFRLLGSWIASKYKPKTQKPHIEANQPLLD